ncbi:MAG: DUF2244 domain-containing protein [Xanthobacteraceae bacterium]
MRSVNEPTIFSAEITPHRSLNGAGFLAAMLVFTAASLALVVVFVTAGAWPVAGFLGLDIALVYFAFKVNFRRAAAQEFVHVTPSALNVRRISHKGEVAEFSLNPLWVRLHREVDPDYGMRRLVLVSRGKHLTIAEHLSPPERESFANALAAAIGEAKRGLTVTRFDEDDEPPGNRVDGPRRPA